MQNKISIHFLFIIAFYIMIGCNKNADNPKNNRGSFEADIDGRHWIADSVTTIRYPGFNAYGQNVFVIVASTIAGESIQLRTSLDLPSSQVFREVTIVTFNAKKDIGNSNDIVLTWATINEQDALKFEVERSNDGINYIKTGEVPAAGNTTTETNYTWHEKPSAAFLTYYYRLHIINTDGTATYSQTVVINLITVAAYFSSESDTAYHYGFDGNITLATTDTVQHKISGTFFFKYADDTGNIKHSIQNGIFKDLPY